MAETDSLLDTINRRRALGFGRLIQYLGIAKGDPMLASGMADGKRDARVKAALQGMIQSPSLGTLIERGAVSPGTTSDSSWAGPLAPLVPLASEFVEYLRPLTIVGRLDVRSVPFQISFSRGTSGVAATFVGQGVPYPLAAMAFDTIQLPFSRLGIIVPATQDLVRFSSPDATGVIVDDCARACQQGLDAAFLDPNHVAVSGVSPASITNGLTAISSSGNSAAALSADALSAMLAMDAGRIPLNEATWIMSQRVAAYIATLRTSTGAAAFPDFALIGGKWFGLPVLVSGAVLDSTDSPPKEIIALVHGNSIAVADAGAEVAVSPNVALQSLTNPQTGAQSQVPFWQNSLVAIKVTRFTHWMRRRDAGVQFIQGITV